MKRAIAMVALVSVAALAAAQHKKAAPGTSPAAHGPSVAAQLEQIEHKWADAEVKRDPAMIAPYLDPAMMQTNPDGSQSARKQVLESIAKGDPTLRAVDLADMQTLSYGDAAVIMGHYTERHESAGKNTDVSGRFTDTYVKRGGHWKCVASHDSVAAKE